MNGMYPMIMIAICSTLTLSSVATAQTFQESLSNGIEAIEMRKGQEAISHLTKAIHKAPKSADAYYYRGCAYRLINDSNSWPPQKASKYKVFDIQTSPEHISVHYITKLAQTLACREIAA